MTNRMIFSSTHLPWWMLSGRCVIRILPPGPPDVGPGACWPTKSNPQIDREARLGCHGMVCPFVTVAANIEDDAEGAGIVSFFGALINQAAKFPIGRCTIQIGFHEVLLHLLPNGFEQVTEMANKRIDLE